MPFTFTKLKIPDLILIEGRKFADERGFFTETYKASEFMAAGITETFVQDNYSVSQKGVVRGLHYQLPPFAQGKLVQVLRGKVFDVAVDIRANSATFGQWVGVELSGDDSKLFYIPPGFAHGFMALENETQFMYKCTAEYDKLSERSILWSDKELGIVWPDIVSANVSPKDAEAPLLNQAELF
ncbi:MAG: dTDP-4-dehydrorhamnose 3,5-epimerase [bacterium]